ncbi:hypothetical protein EYR40_003257 [Pleurotus pulmonarius]|nr:hypothetical protein EYR40_003257 [Pleurotus pulmonarius]KAF4605985.1 hypothetical protein EYR38_000030 [Pleurotus pulmonarius]
MAIVLPIEISRMIIACVEDKKTLLNLLFTTNAFRLLVEPHLYADVSLINAPATQDPTRYRRPVLDTVLWAVSRSFLHGITAGGGRCARYVKRLHLPAFCLQNGVLTQLGMLKGVPKLRYLRILLRGVFDGTEDEDPMISPMISPWGYEDMVKAFDSLLSLTHIIVQFTCGPGAPEYFCFAKGAVPPVKLRSLRLPPEWWHDDWVQDCADVPFQQGDRRMGYTGDLIGGVGNL